MLRGGPWQASTDCKFAAWLPHYCLIVSLGCTFVQQIKLFVTPISLLFVKDQGV